MRISQTSIVVGGTSRIDELVLPGETVRIELNADYSAAFTVGLRNLDMTHAATCTVTTSERGATNPIVQALNVGDVDGVLPANTTIILPIPTKARALIVSMPAEATLGTIVEVLQ